MTAPERILVATYSGKTHSGYWGVDDVSFGPKTYILATPEALAASPEVQALVMAERERCAGICSESAIMTRYYDEGAGDGPNTRAEVAEDLAAAIRAGTEGGE